jgi:long-chain acyl-CoA synthetase
LNWHGSTEEIAHILSDSNAKVLLVHSDLLPKIDRDLTSVGILSIPSPTPSSQGKSRPAADIEYPDFNALANAASPIAGPAEKVRGLFAYTSGSTGRPKGIQRPDRPELPDRYGMYQMLAKTFMLLEPSDTFYMSAPLYHSAPNTLSLSALAADDVNIIIDPQFDPEGFLATVEKHQISHAYIVPTMMVRLLKLPQIIRDKYNVSSLRYSVSTGSPCPIDVKRSMIDWFGPIFYESYGASELGFMTLISSAEAIAKPGSVGRAREGTHIKILADDMSELPAQQTGSIFIHAQATSGFSYTNSEGDLDDQHNNDYATVGDIGHLDSEGYLFISDRRKEMVISGGANIFPSEIEAEILKMDSVIDCAVFGAPDPEFGESIVAAVQLAANTSLTLQQLRDFLEPHLARFKMPRILDIHDQLPREDSGKIFKKHLKAPYWEGQGRKI